MYQRIFIKYIFRCKQLKYRRYHLTAYRKEFVFLFCYIVTVFHGKWSWIPNFLLNLKQCFSKDYQRFIFGRPLRLFVISKRSFKNAVLNCYLILGFFEAFYKLEGLQKLRKVDNTCCKMVKDGLIIILKI